MLKRGAPAPQCDPVRMSYPSSVSVIPLTRLITAPADASFSVSPVFTSKRPAFSLSFGSPVGQAASVKLEGPKRLKGGLGLKLSSVAFVGQPAPSTQRAATRSVL